MQLQLQLPRLHEESRREGKASAQNIPNAMFDILGMGAMEVPITAPPMVQLVNEPFLKSESHMQILMAASTTYPIGTVGTIVCSRIAVSKH